MMNNDTASESTTYTDISKSIDACAAHYGDNAKAMKRYL